MIKRIGIIMIFVLVVVNINFIYTNQNLKKEFRKELLFSRNSINSIEINQNKEIFSELINLASAPLEISNKIESVHVKENVLSFEISGTSLKDIEDTEIFLSEILRKPKISMKLFSEGNLIRGTIKYGGI